MALAPPKKKKLIKIAIIILSLVQDQMDHDEYDTAQNRVRRLLCQAECLAYNFDENESNWSNEQTTLWAIVEEIDVALDPAALEPPTDSDYEGWETRLIDAIAALS